MSISEPVVLTEITEMIRTVLDDYGAAGVEIGRDTRFGEDLDMESIDLVTLAGMLGEWYGPSVNFPEYLAGLELEEIIELSVGHLVDHVTASLRHATVGG